MTLYGFNVLVILALAAVLVGLRWLRPSMLVWAAAWWLAVYSFIRFAFATPVPASVQKLYLGILTLALFAYITSDRTRAAGFMRPIAQLVTTPRLRPVLVAILVAIPALAAWNVWAKMRVPLQAPAFGRTIHPAPPSEITVHDQPVSLITAVNPYRELAATEPEAYAKHLGNGKRVYYENCFYCHGDAMAGDGMYAHSLNPIPSNFTDAGVLPNLQESFIFWRISKGGPGLPEEGGPWDTAMPAWESFLTTEEMWDVALFVYEFNGYKPRAREEGHE